MEEFPQHTVEKSEKISQVFVLDVDCTLVNSLPAMLARAAVVFKKFLGDQKIEIGEEEEKQIIRKIQQGIKKHARLGNHKGDFEIIKEIINVSFPEKSFSIESYLDLCSYQYQGFFEKAKKADGYQDEYYNQNLINQITELSRKEGVLIVIGTNNIKANIEATGILGYLESKGIDTSNVFCLDTNSSDSSNSTPFKKGGGQYLKLLLEELKLAPDTPIVVIGDSHCDRIENQKHESPSERTIQTPAFYTGGFNRIFSPLSVLTDRDEFEDERLKAYEYSFLCNGWKIMDELGRQVVVTPAVVKLAKENEYPPKDFYDYLLKCFTKTQESLGKVLHSGNQNHQVNPITVNVVTGGIYNSSWSAEKTSEENLITVSSCDLEKQQSSDATDQINTLIGQITNQTSTEDNQGPIIVFLDGNGRHHFGLDTIEHLCPSDICTVLANETKKRPVIFGYVNQFHQIVFEKWHGGSGPRRLALRIELNSLYAQSATSKSKDQVLMSDPL